ncbi:phosphatidylinositol 3-kinase-like protein [Leptomonas pyrrhocoris]|uniref:non-specific serine/threonine protein kinase n=1 Tax=Leptomonas pyrrhocoris TaxID=157538 RepID=A0A0M9FS08_LEPPY|nr:phosphatidylinositol 3-kinase-like protein [Leptomonas pyrrhocoris]KPA74843.1 phosphatidylinositol 3-kinase-like protein [Leptomonas pyrrhocoris]|eukprot:XP_015653282.1 phosphatidylinositol 3-kinase-like protein [Leptomonas pyrrhocoris]
MAEGEPLTSQQQQQRSPSGTGSGDAARVAWEKGLDPASGSNGRFLVSDRTGVEAVPHASTVTSADTRDVFGVDAADALSLSSAVAFAQSLSQAPLLWKSASPLNLLCNHILEVLESQWLVAVVGADYAALLLEVLRWGGYARLVTPTYLVRLSGCLVGLLERVPLGSPSLADASAGNDGGVTAVSPNLVLQEVVGGRVWAAAPSADDACVYAQVLVRLYSLPQVTSAYPPSAAAQSTRTEAASTNYTRADNGSSSGGSDALALTRRLMELIRARHQIPTPDLRLEAYIVAALRQLCRRFQHDHPAAARAPVEVVKLLCNFFFLPHHTPRHDVWRLEVMQFVTTVLSYTLADLVAEELWSDLHAAGSQKWEASNAFTGDSAEDGAVKVLNVKRAEVTADAARQLQSHREVLALLHHTVYPTMCRIFTQHRHEYSFTSRRELFSYPCSPLQEVFDFGAVVLYLCSATYSMYGGIRGAASRAGDVPGGVAEIDDAERRGASGTPAERQPQRKRRRAHDSHDDGADSGEGEVGNAEGDLQAPSRDVASQSPHPVQLLCDALTNEFFQPSASPSTAATPTAPPTTTARRRHRSRAAPPLVLIIRTAGIRTNSAALQDVMSDRSLFLLHLFAQPCATMRCPPHIADALVEDVLLPLSATFGLRMGLLLAAIRAVVPRCSATTQFFAFAQLAQRSLPAQLSGTGSGAVVVTSSVREDLVNPSEPMYRVLVTLLERRLSDDDRRHRPPSWRSLSTVDGSHVSVSAATAETTVAAVPPLDDVHVGWETHLQAAVSRIQSQLHAFEQAVRRVREVRAMGISSGEAAALPLVGADAEGGPSAATAAAAASAAALAPTSADPSLSYAPVLSPSLALLLTRFATLVQCVRLSQLAAPSKLAEGVDLISGGVGLDFVSLVVAHGADFYADVPLLHRLGVAAGNRRTSPRLSSPLPQPNELSTKANETTTGVAAFARDRSSSAHAANAASVSLTSLSAAAGSASGAAFLLLFSPADFMGWLAAAEEYACAVLWTCRAQQQIAQRSQQQLYRVPMARDGPAVLSMRHEGGAGAAAVASSLHGPLRAGVGRYLAEVCAGVEEAAADPAANVPAVLYDAAAGHWMLRVSSHSNRQAVTQRPPSLARQDEEMEEYRHQHRRCSPQSPAAATDASPLPPSIGEVAPRPSLPRSFQTALATSVQGAVTWLMRRSQLLESVNARVAALDAGANLPSPPSSVDGVPPKEVRGGAVLRDHNAEFAAAHSSAVLLLSVQCVQLLHLLLRWRRAGLWFPPEEGGDFTSAAGAAAATTTTKTTAGNIKQRGENRGARVTKVKEDGAAAAQRTTEQNIVNAGAEAGRAASTDTRRTSEDNEEAPYNDAPRPPRPPQPFLNEPHSTTNAITADAAARADVRVLATSPRLFDSPASMLARFSIRGGGRLYYTVLWLCHHLLGLQQQRHHRADMDVLSTLPLWAALHALYRDVGSVFLDPSMACVDPRQTILQLTAAVTQRCFYGGVAPLSRWRPSNPHSRELTLTVTSALRLSLDTLRIVLTAARRTGIHAYAATPLMDVADLRQALLRLLEQQSLAEGSASWTTTRSGGAEAAATSASGDFEDVLLPSQHALLTQKYPFLPTVLPVLPALLRLFTVLSTAQPPDVALAGEAGSKGGRAGTLAALVDGRTLVRLLQVLFARYRYQTGPALCSEVMGGVLADVEGLLRIPAHSTPNSGNTTLSTGEDTAAKERRVGTVETASAALCYTQSGRLLELWTAQLTDPNRVDMPVCTPQWQCALLQAAFAVLVRCEPAVAEVLGRFSFEFLSESTPFAVRRHAALHVGVLFRTFSMRRAQVLRTLLVKAREGMLSPTPMLCSTSLLALSEAVRAAPELRVEVIYTLLECWATRGFAQRHLIVECLTRLAEWAEEDAAWTTTVALPACARRLLYTSLCRMHVRPLLFRWLCEYKHPLIALPVACFGYAALDDFVADQLPVLLPLALLLLTESKDAETVVWREMRPPRPQQDLSTSGGGPTTAAASAAAAHAQGSVFHQLLQVYTEKMLCTSVAAEGENTRARRPKERSGAPDGVPASAAENAQNGAAEELRQLAPLCLVLQYFSSIVVQLLVIASNAPVPLFGVEAAELDVSSPTGGGHADWSRQAGQRQASERGRRSSGLHHSTAEAPTKADWCDAAQKCLYWLEALLNTCEAAALVQGGAWAWLGRLLPSEACAVTDVSPTAAAAVSSPAVTLNAAEVLVFYLQRLSAWPTARPIFDSVLAAHMDAMLSEMVRLHRTVAEPAQLVYATPAQLQWVLTWVAEKVTALPLMLEGSATTAPASAGRTAASSSPLPPRHPEKGRGESREDEVIVVVEDTQELASSVTGPADLYAWQAWCLRLLVPPPITTTTAALAVARDGEVGSRARRSLAEVLSSHDALSSLFLLGDSTFLRSLLHIAYRSCTAPTSLECVLRGSQQLSLLTWISTRWCSSRVLAQAPALQAVLTYLLHWLRRDGSTEVYRAVCNALLHVWPVAVSNTERAAGGGTEDDAGTTETARREKDSHGVDEDLWTCAVLLSRAMEPLLAMSPVVAATWTALCRSDPNLLRCEWHRRAAAYVQDSLRGTGETSAKGDRRGDDTFRRAASCEVVEVSDSTDDDDEEAKQRNNEDNTASQHATALPPEMHTWNWSTYLAYRNVSLAPLQCTTARRSLATFVTLLHHTCGRDDLIDDIDSSAAGSSETERARPAADVEDSQWRRISNVTDAVATATTAPPPPSFLRNVAAGVDGTRTLIIRCLEVAAVCSRAGAEGLLKERSSSSSATSTSIRPAERMAMLVRHALLVAVSQLYRWSIACPMNEANLWSVTADWSSTTAAASTASAFTAVSSAATVSMMDSENSEDQALACFELLRSLSLCVVHAGETAALTSTIESADRMSSRFSTGVTLSCGDSSTGCVGTNDSKDKNNGGGGGASAEQLVTASLGHAYVEQLYLLEQLAAAADARRSELAVGALRMWTLSLQRSAQGDTAAAAGGALSSFDAAVVAMMCGACAASDAHGGEEKVAKARRSVCAAYAPSLLHRLSWAVRSVGSSVTAATNTAAITRSTPFSFDLAPPSPPPCFSSAHLTDASVWRPLRTSPPIERAFVCRFVAAMANTYGILKKSAMWTSLLPLLYEELQRTGDAADGATDEESGVEAASPLFSSSGSLGGASVAARLLTPLLLHVLCLRESDGQRATRREWSELVDKYVLQQADQRPYTARLFLHALYACHVVLVRLTRQRGLKGSIAADKPSSSSSTNNNNNSSAGNASEMGSHPSSTWPAAFGSVPVLHDMRECYWLSDIPATHLARAAVAVQEPHLALLFAQLSGESLFGPRTGCAALCGEMETTRTAVMLRGVAVGAPAAAALSSAPYSVLFPYATYEDYPASSSSAAAGKSAPEVAARSGGRARDRHEGVRQQTQRFMQHIFTVYEAVQQQVDLDDVSGVSVMVRHFSRRPTDPAICNGVEEAEEGTSSNSTLLHAACVGPVRLARDTISGTVVRRCAPLRVSTEGDAAMPNEEFVNTLRDLEEAAHSNRGEVPTSRAVRDDPSGGVDRKGGRAAAARSDGDLWSAALQRAARLLERGLPSTSMDVLLNLRTHYVDAQVRAVPQVSALPSPSPHSSDGGSANSLLDLAAVSTKAAAAVASATVSERESAPWTADHEACLRSLLSQAAWRCARWTSGPSIGLFSVGAHTQTDNVGGTAAAAAAALRESRAGMCKATAVSPAVLERLAQPFSPSSSLPSLHSAPSASPGEWVGGGFYEHLLNSFLALSSGEPLLCLPHLRSAEASLRLQLSATSLVTTVVAAEALREVRQCANAMLTTAASTGRRSGVTSPMTAASGTPSLPNWRMAENNSGDGGRRKWSSDADHGDDGHYYSNHTLRLDTARLVHRIGSTSWQLMDSVRHALSQIYGDKDEWYRFLIGATERALAFHEPGLAHRWLTDWERQSEVSGDGAAAGLSPPSFPAQQRRVDVALRKAQVAYALGRWQEALALLQPPASSSSLLHGTTPSVTAPFTTPLEPRVVQQLMLWHAELQLVPASQLVRDPFLSRAAASDNTGACSFLLARLCHTLASEIADRLTSHEHRQLEESVEESKRQRRELEAQLHAATTAITTTATATATATSTAAPLAGGTNRADAPQRSGRGNEVPPAAAAAGVAVLSDEQLRLLRRRIRELTGDIKRLEDEWEAEKSNYGLYRRSALNAYSRLLQFHHLGSSSSAASSPPPLQQHAHVRGGAPAAADHPAVTCLPQDVAENTLHAVFGFVELWLNAADIEQSSGEVLGKVLDKAVERIPTAVFLPLASQLTAQLGGPQDADRLSYLVGRIARDYPLPVVWPLLTLRHGHTFAKSREVNALHAVDEAKIKAAQTLLADLASTTSSHKTVTGHAGRAAAAAAAASSTSASVATQVRHAQLLSSAYLELAFDRGANAAQTERRYPIPSDFVLIKDAHHLVIPPPTSLLSSSATSCSAENYLGGGDAVPCAPQLAPHIVRYRPFFTTPGGVNVPKVLLCELSDGQVVRQLLKAGDDLRQDALIEHVFATANALFHRRAATRPLRVRTFAVVPLAPTAGVLQWVENTVPLGEYVTGHCHGRQEHPGAHERYFPGEPTTRECRLQLQNAPPRSKAEALLKLYEAFTPALHYFFFEHATSAQVFVSHQQTFTRSVAASSMMGYIVGLGDRHINNMLLHQQTAEVVHIDLGIAFDQSRLLPVPELVPFRMTRNIIDGLGVRGTEGSLRPCAEAALGLLREKRDLLRTLFSAITHDPLARWAIGGQMNVDAFGAARAAATGDEGNAESEVMPQHKQQQQLLQASTRQAALMRTRPSNADAARTLARIDAKLQGYDGGDVLSVATHVRKLVEEAQRVELLAVMFPGWSQWV